MQAAQCSQNVSKPSMQGGGELGEGSGGEGEGGGGLGDWQPPQVSLQFCRTFFLLHLSSSLSFLHVDWLQTSTHVVEGVQSLHASSHFVWTFLHDLVLHSGLHLLFLTFLPIFLAFLAHLFSPHTLRHEPVTARARPGDLGSEKPSRLALVDAPPPGNTQMRSSSTCIAEDERLDPSSATCRKRGERGCLAVSGCLVSGWWLVAVWRLDGCLAGKCSTALLH